MAASTAERLEKLEEEVGNCPLKIEAIQFYAEMFEKSNQNHSENVFEFKKVNERIDQLQKESHLIIGLLRKLIK